jgi:DNA-binding transcriptional MerR regulator
LEDPSGSVMCRGAARLSTGDLARGCDTTVRTIRFYEEAGLLEPAPRTDGGHRVFDLDQLPRLQLIMDLREAGLSLQDIRALFALRQGHDDARSASDRLCQTLQTQVEAMQRKIDVLRRLQEELSAVVSEVQACRTCESPRFQARCGGCEVMERPDLPRAMRLLWGPQR